MLRRYVPNVLREVAGEATLFSKIAPSLEAAERWVADELTGDAVIDRIAEEAEQDRQWQTVAGVVACKAMAECVPMLDLVLTPNGFGVVNNSNVAPASRERVDRLVAALRSRWQCLAARLLDDLRSDQLWHQSHQFTRWSTLLVSPLDLSRLAGDGTMPLTDYDQRHAEQAGYEQAIAREFVGEEYMASLRYSWWTDTVGVDDLRIVNDVMNAVALSLKQGKPRMEALVATVDMIRRYPSAYPLWHTSPIAELYSHEPFKNKKENHGYFL